MRGEFVAAASAPHAMDPLMQQQSPSSGSFYLNQSPLAMMPQSAVMNGGTANELQTQRGDARQQTATAAATTDNAVGKSTSTASSGSKKRSKKRSVGKNGASYEDYLNEMPTVNDLDRINQLMTRFSTGNPPSAYNLYAGYQKGDDLMEVMLENSRKGFRLDSSPQLGENNLSWGRGGPGSGLPHPMMMMPGQQNLMTNYFTPSLMMKTPNNFMNTDYASLPPAINLGQNLLEEDAVDGVESRGQQSLNEKLRFSSDPGGSDNENVSSSGGERPTTTIGDGGGPVNRSKSSGSSKRGLIGDSSNLQSNESTSSGSSGTGASGSLSENPQQHRQRSRSSRSAPMGDQRILGTLLEQINLLHETNSKICRNLHDTKVEIEALKHAPSWGLRHRRDSISGLSTHSQPLGFPAFGTQSPAPASFHSGAYTPGMMTDVVREVREGARVREEAMLNRVKSLVDERSWQSSEVNYKLQREVEDLKNQVQELKRERQETSHRMSELELELKTMRIVFGAQLQALGGFTAVNAGGVNQSIAQQVAASLRSASLSNHSTLESPDHRQKNESTPLSSRPARNHLNIKYGVLSEQESPLEVLPGGGDVEEHERELMEKLVHRYQMGNGNGNSISNGNGSGTNGDVATDARAVVQQEKDTLDLRRELQDAVAGKKSAEQRILTLEKEMQSMQESLKNRRPSEPIKLNNFSKSETVLNRGSLNGDSVGNRGKAQQANSVQTLVVGTTTTTTAAGGGVGVATSPPKGNGFCLTGPVTDL